MKNKIQSFEDACKTLGLIPPELPNNLGEFNKKIVADYKLMVITKALNGPGWKADFANWDQAKYTPWFVVRDGRFVLHGVAEDYTYLRLGAHLCFKNRELAEYAAEQFKDLYKDLLIY